MSRRRSLWILPAAVLAATAIAGAPAVAQEEASDPESLAIAFVPSREADALVENIDPLAEALSAALGMPVEGFVTSDYVGSVTALETGQAHVAALPPLGLVQAVDRAGAEFILQSERFGSPTYHTQFFTTDPDTFCTDEPVPNEREEEGTMLTFLNCNGTARAFDESPEGPIGIESLANVEPGTTVSFVEQTSASGYIFPATIFANAGLDPETDLSPLFAGAHDASVIAVCNGQAVIGVSFDDARQDAVTDCDVANTVVVFAYGPEIPNDGMAVAGSLSDDLKARIKAALLEYAATPEGSEVLGSIYNITALTEPNLDSLQIIRDAAAQLGYGQ
jgi:phosphonate transport system substrate-binding protein